jgi:putative methionine-R-sulfoxide reductase with GAF domain
MKSYWSRKLLTVPKDRTLYNPVETGIGDGITGSVAKTGKPELIPDTSQDSCYIVDDDIRHSEICVSIMHEDTLYGVIDCEHPTKNVFISSHQLFKNHISHLLSQSRSIFWT